MKTTSGPSVMWEAKRGFYLDPIQFGRNIEPIHLDKLSSLFDYISLKEQRF
jgi:hypothetical protein